MIWWNTLSLPYENQKFKGVKKEIRAVDRKQGSAVPLEGNFAPTPCSLPCVTADAWPPVDNTVLVLVLFGTLLPGISCCLWQDMGWFLGSSLPSLGAVGTASLPAAASGAKLRHSEKRSPRHLSCVLGKRCPLLFLLMVHTPAPEPSQSMTGLNMHMGAKKGEFLQSQILPHSFHSGTMMNVYAHSTDCSLAEAVIFSSEIT